jgi:phospholipid N-methyltransferase
MEGGFYYNAPGEYREEANVKPEFSLYRRRALFALGALPLARLGRAAEDVEAKRTGGPFVPTPQVVVDEMLRIGKVGSSDFVIDLGSGDGIIVLTAAQRLKARGLGVDIDPALVKLANNEAKKRGISDRATFEVQDVFKADISRATVVTLYLLPGMMVNLRPKILDELKPGTRVVSHDYHFDEWQADDRYTWDVPEKEKVNGVPSATVYLWVVPAKIAGRWQVQVPGATVQHELVLRQRYQTFSGEDTRGGKLVSTVLNGENISFTLPAGGGREVFKGRVSGDTMEGMVELPGGKGAAKWTAARVKA